VGLKNSLHVRYIIVLPLPILFGCTTTMLYVLLINSFGDESIVMSHEKQPY